MRFRAITALVLLLAADITAAQDAPRAPVVVAHRGLLKHAPENTLPNFRACLELRLGFEFDVRRSRDGHLVCVHDATVDRTTDGTGQVTGLTLAELRRFDAGGWFGPAFRGEKIPTIDEIFALLAARRDKPVLVAADLKGEDELLERDVVALANKHGVLDRVLFIGRAIEIPTVRRQLRDADPKSHIGCLANRADEFEKSLADKDADWVYVRYIPSSAELTRVHAAGKRAFIAGPTVQEIDEPNWRAAVAAGMDGILTDYPLELTRVLNAPVKPR